MVQEPGGTEELPQRQRVAAYAVIVRDDQILLSRLAPYLVAHEQWTLPGGGIDFGEDPRDAVVREVYEETRLEVQVGDRAWIDPARRYASLSDTDMHSVRMVFEGWAPADSPEPRVIEVDGSTVDARWVPLALVLRGLPNQRVASTLDLSESTVKEHLTGILERLGVKTRVEILTRMRGLKLIQ